MSANHHRVKVFFQPSIQRLQFLDCIWIRFHDFQEIFDFYKGLTRKWVPWNGQWEIRDLITRIDLRSRPALTWQIRGPIGDQSPVDQSGAVFSRGEPQASVPVSRLRNTGPEWKRNIVGSSIAKVRFDCIKNHRPLFDSTFFRIFLVERLYFVDENKIG